MFIKYLHVVFLPKGIDSAFTISSPAAEFSLVSGLNSAGLFYQPSVAPVRALIPGVDAVPYAPDLTELAGFFKFELPMKAVVLATYSALPPLVTFQPPVSVASFEFAGYDGDTNTTVQNIKITDGTAYSVTYNGSLPFPPNGFRVGVDWPFSFPKEYAVASITV